MVQRPHTRHRGGVQRLHMDTNAKATVCDVRHSARRESHSITRGAAQGVNIAPAIVSSVGKRGSTTGSGGSGTAATAFFNLHERCRFEELLAEECEAILACALLPAKSNETRVANVNMTLRLVWCSAPTYLSAASCAELLG